MFFKVCGMRRQEDLDAASGLGFALCGFIFHPKSPRYADPEIVAGLRSGNMLRVGVFVTGDADGILPIVRAARLDLVQLHGGQDRECAAKLARALGRNRLVRVLWPERCGSADAFRSELGAASEDCGLLLLDAGSSGGGHGRCVPADLLKEVPVPRPWILAGGLGPDGLGALGDLPPDRLPDGLDLNSKLETSPGVKSEERMRRALALAASAGFPPAPFPGA